LSPYIIVYEVLKYTHKYIGKKDTCKYDKIAKITQIAKITEIAKSTKCKITRR